MISLRRLCLCVAFVLAAGTGAGLAHAAAPGFEHVLTVRDSGRVEGVLYRHSGFADSSGAQREVFVLLPPSYGLSSDADYPVLYAVSGRILFADTPTSGDEWTLDDILVRRPAGLPEILVVSVDSGEETRLDQAPPGSTPGARGEALLGFLTETVQPFIAGSYRIRRDRASAFILGTGDGALFALYAAWSRADRFAGALALGTPDVDARSMAWVHTGEPAAPLWIWFEQASADRARPSSADFLAALRRHADVQHLVTGPTSNRTARLLAALRACPWR